MWEPYWFVSHRERPWSSFLKQPTVAILSCLVGGLINANCDGGYRAWCAAGLAERMVFSW